MPVHLHAAERDGERNGVGVDGAHELHAACALLFEQGRGQGGGGVTLWGGAGGAEEVYVPAAGDRLTWLLGTLTLVDSCWSTAGGNSGGADGADARALAPLQHEAATQGRVGVERVRPGEGVREGVASAAAAGLVKHVRAALRALLYQTCSGTRFTCFTGTKVQILTPEELLAKVTRHTITRRV
jgi:hypothetical protein